MIKALPYLLEKRFKKKYIILKPMNLSVLTEHITKRVNFCQQNDKFLSFNDDFFFFCAVSRKSEFHQRSLGTSSNHSFINFRIISVPKDVRADRTRRCVDNVSALPVTRVVLSAPIIYACHTADAAGVRMAASHSTEFSRLVRRWIVSVSWCENPCNI